MTLIYRGISYNPSSEMAQSPTVAKYRGIPYTITNTPVASSVKLLKYRGVSYVTGGRVADQLADQGVLSGILPAFSYRYSNQT